MSGGERFLHQTNPDFHATPEVEDVVAYLRSAGDHIPNAPAPKIEAYLGFLADQVDDGILTNNEDSLDRQIEAHVIKAEDVPEGYYELQRRIAREQGRGDVQLDDQTRREHYTRIRKDQLTSLQDWTDYLTDCEDEYPDWFKYFVFSAVTRLGDYNPGKKMFNERSTGTIASYPELNVEALAIVWDSVSQKAELLDKKARNKKVPKQARQKFTEDERAVLATPGNFNKLYSEAMRQATSGYPTAEELETTAGNWRLFEQIEDPEEATELTSALRGRGTGWCIEHAGDAEEYLLEGDFMIYFTRDHAGNETIPRLAVHVVDDEVSEVRGIVGGAVERGTDTGPGANTRQDLEPVMVGIAEDKLRKLPGGDEYFQKAYDMKRLTSLEKKIKANMDVSLDSDELHFLYELDRGIEGFGFTRDPRIAEIRRLRGDRDKPELTRMLPESILKQCKHAFAAYETVAEPLAGKGRWLFRRPEHAVLSSQEFEQHFAATDRKWRENGTYDYMLDQIIQGDGRIVLVATPDVAARKSRIISLAKNFGHDQSYGTRISKRLEQGNYYKDQELSANSSSGAVRFSLFSTAIDPKMSHLPADEQLRQLRARQRQYPKQNIRVPSLLDAVTYWYSLRAQGDELIGDEAFTKTYIRHFDLKPYQLNHKNLFLQSYVDDDGEPFITSSDLTEETEVRLAVG